MSWITAIGAGASLLASQSGGGGGGFLGGGGGAAPAAPSSLDSGKIDFGGVNLTPKASGAPAWLWPVVGLVAAVLAVVAFVTLSRPRRR